MTGHRSQAWLRPIPHHRMPLWHLPEPGHSAREQLAAGLVPREAVTGTDKTSWRL
jgi:hypothetical protein